MIFIGDRKWKDISCFAPARPSFKTDVPAGAPRHLVVCLKVKFGENINCHLQAPSLNLVPLAAAESPPHLPSWIVATHVCIGSVAFHGVEARNGITGVRSLLADLWLDKVRSQWLLFLLLVCLYCLLLWVLFGFWNKVEDERGDGDDGDKYVRLLNGSLWW